MTQQPVLTTTATKNSPVGTYIVNISGGAADNYTFNYGEGNMEITKAQLIATPNNTTRIYGDSNPTFNATYEGLMNNETAKQAFSQQPTFNTTATVKSGVGVYPITMSGGTSTNYEISQYNSGELTIIKRDLTVKADDCSKVYGEDNPDFTITYSGFANSDNKNSLKEQPIISCEATKESNAGSYPINVKGGEADNYSFIYENGTLTIKPITIGFKNIYNTITYHDMNESVTENWFEYIPEIVGEYNEDDFYLTVWALDAEEKYTQHETTIAGGEYAGKYINYSGPSYVGKYIINLESKGTNPNVTAEPSRAYLTVTQGDNNLEWNDESIISVEVGKSVNLGITYNSDAYCQYSASFDTSLIKFKQIFNDNKELVWSVTGLSEGTTTLTFGVINNKNDWGYYNFSDSPTVERTIKVVPNSGINEVVNDENAPVEYYNLQGVKVENPEKGIYIKKQGNKTTKVVM